jgi:hypothetical protein
VDINNVPSFFKILLLYRPLQFGKILVALEM